MSQVDLPSALDLLTNSPEFADGVVLASFVRAGPFNETNPFFETQKKLTFSPLAVSGNYGVVTVRYDKINWSAMPPLLLSEVDFAAVNAKAELLTRLSEHVSVVVAFGDIVNDALAVQTVNGLTTFTVAAHPQALLWEGSLTVGVIGQVETPPLV